MPIQLYVHEDVPDDFHEDIKDAVDIWNQAAGKVLFEVPIFYLPGTSTPEKDGHSVVYWLKDWEPEKDNEQGRTTVYWRRDQIREADVRINGKDFKFFFGEELILGQVHFKSLLIHELGHALGLDHNAINGSVMNPTLRSGFMRDEVKTVDQASLSCEY